MRGPSLRRGTRHATFPIMKKPADGLTLLLPLLALLLARSPRARAAETASKTPYPPSRTVNVTDVLHGVPVTDPYRWLEDAKSPEVQAWMKAQDDLTRQRLASLPGRDAIASRLKELYYIDVVYAPIAPGIAVFLHAAACEQGKERRVLERRGRRRREGPFRPEHLERGRQRLSGRVAGLLGREARRLPEEGQQLRRGDALRDGRRDREGLRRGRHRGRQVRARVLDAGRQGLLLHVAARGPEDPGVRPAGLCGGAPAPARHRPEDRRRREGEDGRSDGRSRTWT